MLNPVDKFFWLKLDTLLWKYAGLSFEVPHPKAYKLAYNRHEIPLIFLPIAMAYTWFWYVFFSWEKKFFSFIVRSYSGRFLSSKSITNRFSFILHVIGRGRNCVKWYFTSIFSFYFKNVYTDYKCRVNVLQTELFKMKVTGKESK